MLKLAEQELAKYKRQKEDELARLEQEYQNALADIGMGHEGIQEQEEYVKWQKNRQRANRELAQVRGDHAISVANYRQATKEKIRENKLNLRRCVQLTEQMRAAEVRAGEDRIKDINKVRVVEIDANSKKKKVRFLDKGKFVPAGPTEDNVRRIPLSALDMNGVEAAIVEQEAQEKKRWEEEKWQIEMAKMRGEAALRKLRAEKENTLFSGKLYPDTSTDKGYDTFDNGPVRRIGDELDLSEHWHTRRATLIKSKRDRPSFDESAIQRHPDLDRFPIRGPSSAESTPIVVSSPTSSSAEGAAMTGNDTNGLSPLADVVMSRYPTDPRGRPVMGGPASAFKDPKSEDAPPVETAKYKEVTIQGTPSHGSQAKDNQRDRDFISKVMEDFDFVQDGDEKVKVKINIEEVSEYSSTLSVTQEHGREEVTRTTMKSSSSTSTNLTSSSSSTDITREKFLSADWRSQQIRNDSHQVRELIGQLAASKRVKTDSVDEQQSQKKLRSYIEQLLRMKRNEIDDLSISDVSSLSTSFSTSHVENSSSTPQRTPISILSSSDSRSSSANKTVRFADDGSEQVKEGKHVDDVNNVLPLDHRRKSQADSVDRRGSYEGGSQTTLLDPDELERRRKQIIDRTNLSLTEIQNYYQQQRRQIELELQRRKIIKDLYKKTGDTRSNNNTLSPHPPLSEGPLSAEVETTKDTSPASLQKTSSSSVGNSVSSQKESSLSSNNVEGANDHLDILMRGIDLHKSAASTENRQQLITQQKHVQKSQFSQFSKSSTYQTKLRNELNKTSSSGTTSSSNATAEFLARLRRMEMPRLEGPPPTFRLGHRWDEQIAPEPTDDLNTSVDLLRVKELDTSSDLVMVMHAGEHVGSNKTKDLVQVLGEKERKQAEQNLSGVVSEITSFSSFHFSEHDLGGEEYSSNSILQF